MKIDLSRTMRNLDGSEIQAEEQLTIRDAAITSLITLTEEDRGILPKAKFEYALLAQKIALCDGPVDLSADEIATIKERIGRGYSPLVVLNAWQWLESAQTALAKQ